MVKIAHIDPDQFLLDTLALGRKVYETGFRPKHALSIWRGGTPVGLGVDAYFRGQGVYMNHTTMATESYKGINKQEEVILKGLEHLVKVVCREDELLILDDVYESGRTIGQIVETLRARARRNTPERILVATVHSKPDRHQVKDIPVVCLREVAGDTWIDYPHELADLYDPADDGEARIREKDPRIWEILNERPGEVEGLGEGREAEAAGREAETAGREAETAGREAEAAGREAEAAGREAEAAGREAEAAGREVETAGRKAEAAGREAEAAAALGDGEEHPDADRERQDGSAPYLYLTARDLLYDSLRLGMKIARDDTFYPDFLIALWPGGVSAGLPVHEVIKYLNRRSRRDRPSPDHISINTTRTHLTYRSNVIGVQYLADRICDHHNILIIDTIFRSGRMATDVILKLKEELRRNLNLERIRVASVYFNPEDRSTWTVPPVVRAPDYYLKRVSTDVIYPQSFYRLPDPRQDLHRHHPELGKLLFGP